MPAYQQAWSKSLSVLDNRTSNWEFGRFRSFGGPILLVDVEIPPNHHFAAVPGEHLFQKLFWRRR
jgi:hypothetical protein